MSFLPLQVSLSLLQASSVFLLLQVFLSPLLITTAWISLLPHPYQPHEAANKSLAHLTVGVPRSTTWSPTFVPLARRSSHAKPFARPHKLPISSVVNGRHSTTRSLDSMSESETPISFLNFSFRFLVSSLFFPVTCISLNSFLGCCSIFFFLHLSFAYMSFNFFYFVFLILYLVFEICWWYCIFVEFFIFTFLNYYDVRVSNFCFYCIFLFYLSFLLY